MSFGIEKPEEQRLEKRKEDPLPTEPRAQEPNPSEAGPEDAGSSRCKKDDRQKCYTGPAGTEGTGECQSGLRFCKNDGTWTECRNEVVPTAEVCDGKDNDCNGKVDDGIRPTPCTKQKGVCEGAVQRCEGAKGWRMCEDKDYQKHNAAYEPQETRCDNKDNDCDGVVDTLGPSQTCTLPGKQSDCAKGHNACQNAAPTCTAIHPPQPREICGNKKDDNCDGRVDEADACPLANLTGTSSTLSDFAVLSNGNVVVAYKLKLQCLKPQGTTFTSLKQLTLDATQDTKVISTTTFHGLWVLPQSQRILAVWTYVIKTPQSPWKYRSYFQLLDQSCSPLGTRTLLTEADLDSGQRPVASVAISPQDTFVIALYQDNTGGQLLKFDGDGKQAPQTLSLLPVQRSYCKASGTSTALWVAINGKGQGIAVCSVDFKPNVTVYTRRFDVNRMAFTETKYNVVTTSKGNTQTSFPPSLNENGVARISWRTSTPSTIQHTFLPLQGVGTQPVTLKSNAFASVKPGLLNDTFITGTSLPGVWQRYSENGQLLAEAKASALLVRQSAKGSFTTIQQTPTGSLQLQANAFSLHARLCKGQRCVCQPYEQRECTTDTWYAQLQGSCKVGKQLCLPDGLGWGPCRQEGVRVAEQCNDGVDDDCDGAVDEGCTTLNTFTPPGLDAFDVASDGSVAAAFWNGANLIGYCYRADRSIRRGYTMVSSPLVMTPKVLKGYIQTSLSVRIAKKSGHVLFTWMHEEGSIKTLMSRLYNKDCLPLTPPFAWTTKPHTLLSSGQALHTTLMDDNGNFVTHGIDPKTQNYVLHRFDSKGQSLGKGLTQNKAGTNCINTKVVALHPSDLSGMTVCTDKQGNLVYQRFHLRKGWLDSTPQTLITLAKLGNQKHRPALLQLNNKGDVILMTNVLRELHEYTHFALFFDASFQLQKMVSNGLTKSGDLPYFTNQAKVLQDGDNFVLRNGGSRSQQVTWFRYSPKGALLQQASYSAPATFPLDTLRIGHQQTYLHLGKSIQRGVVKFVAP